MNETKSVRYHRLKRRSGILSLVCTTSVLALLVWSGGSVRLRDFAGSLASAPAGIVAIHVLALAFLMELIALPLAFYGGFTLERRYDMSSTSVWVWLRDHLKAVAIGAVLLLGGAEIVYGLIAWNANWWWLPAALLAAAAAALLARLAPVVLLPMFYEFVPLQRETLVERLVTLSRSAGVSVLGVYQWGLGAKTRRANAALVGTGSTRRILLSDTLLDEYTDDEIEVILAHELAHHVHKDIPRTLLLETALLLVACYAASAILSRLWVPLGLQSQADVASLPLLLLVGGAVMLLSTPIVNAFSRLNERRADRFALKLTNRSDAFVSAMRRLAAQNLLEERPSRTVVWLFHSHPPIAERIEAARSSAW